MEAILLAAGRGVRMESRKPKQFLRLAGKPVMIHPLEVLESVPAITRVWVTYASGQEDELRSLLAHYELSKPVLVEGGATRQQSVWKALQMVQTERVIIHEAVRPFIDKEFVESLIEVEAVAVVPTVAIPFTVAEGGDYMTRMLQRDLLRNIQLPQVFDVAVLRKAHSHFADLGDVTEDSQLVFRLGYPVRFVPGIEQNIKITTPLDLQLAEVIHQQIWGDKL